MLPLSFSSVCKKFSRESCHEVVGAADMGNSRHLQPCSTFHCEHCLAQYGTFIYTQQKTLQILAMYTALEIMWYST